VAIQRLAKLECEQNTGKERLTTMVDDGRRAGDLRIYVDRRIMYRMPKRKFNKAVDGGKRGKRKKVVDPEGPGTRAQLMSPPALMSHDG
jgi:hypothetical protein